MLKSERVRWAVIIRNSLWIRPVEYILSIQTEEGLFDCLVYIASDNDMGKPQAEYIERINAGIKSANLPEDYVEQWIRHFVPEN